MPTPHHQPESPIPEPWKPRFGIGGMLLVMLCFSMMAASAYYLVQALRFGGSHQLAFIAVTLMTPLFLTAAVSICLRWLAWRERREYRRRKRRLD